MATRIRCPYCSAEVGKYCVTPSGRVRQPHVARFDRYRHRMRTEEFLVRRRGDDDRFSLKDGDILRCITYWLDPEKATVLRRESDGYDPQCNQYWHDIAFVGFVIDQAVQ